MVDTDHTRRMSAAPVAAVASSQAQEQTILKNKRVFKYFLRSFENPSNPELFRENAIKFAKWLENPRGYYDKARPEIMRLAMTIQTTLRKDIGISESLAVPFPLEAHMHHPMSQHYVKLAQTIHKFRHLFVEPDLQSLLKKLFESANLPSEDITPPAGGSAQTPPIASASPRATEPPQQGTVIEQRTPNIGFQSTEPAPPNMHPTQANPSASMQSATPQPRAHTQGQGGASTSRNPTSTRSAAQTNRPNLQDAFSIPGRTGSADPFERVMVGSSVTPSSSNATLAEPSPAKKKRKKRKVSLDISKYEDLDVKTFLAKQEQLQSPTIPPPLAPSISGVTAISAQAPGAEQRTDGPLATASSPSKEVIVLDTPSPQVAPVVIKPEPQEAMLPPPQRFTPHEVIDLTLSDDEDSMAVDRALTADVAEESSTSMDVDASTPPAPEVDAQVQAELTVDAQATRVEPPEEAPSHDTPSEPPKVDEVSDGEKQRDESGETDMELASESSRHATEEVPMELDSEPAAATPRPSTSVAETDTTPKANKIAQASPVDVLSAKDVPEGVEASAENAGENHEPTHPEPIGMNVEQEQPRELVPAPPAQVTQSGIYRNEVQVMAFERGSTSKSRLAFELNVDEEQYKSIVTWREQTASILDLKSTMCISLACYPLSQIDPAIPLEPQLAHLASSWPDEGGLTLKVEFNSKMETFSLSPPLFVSPDSTIDLSMFIKVGQNQFFINHYKDWTEYVFVLLRHRPTEKQIEGVETKRSEEEAWQQWLKEMMQPIKIDLPELHLQALPVS